MNQQIETISVKETPFGATAITFPGFVAGEIQRHDELLDWLRAQVDHRRRGEVGDVILRDNGRALYVTTDGDVEQTYIDDVDVGDGEAEDIGEEIKQKTNEAIRKQLSDG